MIKEKILNLLTQHSQHPLSSKEIQKRLEIKPKNIRQFKSALKDLVQGNQIIVSKSGKYRIKKKSRNLTGKLIMNQKGFGFVILDEDAPDVFIPRNYIRDALNGDRVEIRLHSRRGGQRTWGTVQKILERSRTTFVGTLIKSGREWKLEISPFTPERGIRIRKQRKADWKAGQVVVARVIDWGSSQTPLLCEVTKVIGDSNDPRNDFDVIVHSYNYTVDFPKDVLKNLPSLSAKFIRQQSRKRRDLRDRRVLTIDPASAKDHDDGLSIQRVKGGYELGIHIADVSEFVPLHSPLDKEALKRGTSVYLHDQVVPMLPFELSGDLCSLVEGEDRLALSVLVTLDRHFKIKRWEVVESVINCKAFLTYQDVQDILDGKKSSPFVNDCKVLWELSKVYFQERTELGSIDFDIAEPVIELSETGIPHTITPNERLQSHRIVEECMLLANRLIAKRYGGSDKEEGPLIFRIHEKPDQDRLEDFSRLLSLLSILPDKPKKLSTPASIRDLLLKVEDSPYKNLIESLALRSMAKARYSVNNLGHFGLAFGTYCHFTSPIRRFPDLTVHRLVKAALNATPKPYMKDELSSIADWITEQEQKAQNAEREFIRLKQLRWLNERIGEVFTGVISGVIAAGFFVQLDTSLAEGLVPAITLEDDMIFEDDRYLLRGKRTGKEYSLGDMVTVRVVSVDLKKRRANFVLA